MTPQPQPQPVTCFICPPPGTCKCNCGMTTEERVCEHKWDGEEETFGSKEMGYGSSTTCSKCGMSAMSHDMRTGA